MTALYLIKLVNGTDIEIKEVNVVQETEKQFIVRDGYRSRLRKSELNSNMAFGRGIAIYTQDLKQGLEVGCNILANQVAEDTIRLATSIKTQNNWNASLEKIRKEL